MTENALALDSLTITDPAGRVLVDDVSLIVPRGASLTLIGETGSGKSLIAQAVFGLLPRELRASGVVRIGGGQPTPVTDRARLAMLWREQIMLIPQEPSAALDPTMRVGRQMELAGVSRADIPAALADVDLEATTAGAFPFALSGGMAQRVLVATALGVGAPIIVADEPTKGLDPERVSQSVALLAGLAQAGRSLLVITHDPAVARGLGGIVAIMREGRLVESGPAARLLSAPATDYARAWLAADPARWTPCRRCCDMGDLALSAHGLGFAWPGARPLFSGLDIHLPKGGVLAVMGPSGCGKSTLGNILLGLTRPTAGTVEWKGVDIHADPRWLAAQRQRHQKLHQDPIDRRKADGRAGEGQASSARRASLAAAARPPAPAAGAARPPPRRDFGRRGAAFGACPHPAARARRHRRRRADVPAGPDRAERDDPAPARTGRRAVLEPRADQP